MSIKSHTVLRAGSILATVIIIIAAFEYTHKVFLLNVSSDDKIIEISPGETFRHISDKLERKNLLPQRFYWEMYAVLNGFDRRMQFGEYEINTDDTMASMMGKFASGDGILHSLTILPGWNIHQVLKAVDEIPQISVESADMDIIRQHLDVNRATLEGLIFPDTYLFRKGTSNLSLFSQAYEKMNENLAYLWQNRAQNLPLKDPYQALILASIVEKETGQDSERKRIAGVFISRLRRNMRLQSDPTIIYSLGNGFDGNVRKKDLERDTPYNTYIRSGLPPTPIAMPGFQSLEAVLNPEVSGDLYFVSKGDGSHYFSKDYKEHLEAVNKYQLNKSNG